MKCAHCGAELVGRHYRFCPGGACRQAAYRRRRAGKPEDHLAGCGRRGRVPLAGLSRAELTTQLSEIRASVDGTTAALEARDLLAANRHLQDAVDRLASFDSAVAAIRAEQDA